MAITSSEAERALEDTDVVPCLEAPLGDAKKLLNECLAADIPALLWRDECCGKGCAPKLQILVREEDVPRVAALLRDRWVSLAAREGTACGCDAAGEEGPDGEVTCPACGTAGPLVEGACSDCGLVLG